VVDPVAALELLAELVELTEAVLLDEPV